VPQDAQNLRPARFSNSHFMHRTAPDSVVRDDEPESRTPQEARYRPSAPSRLAAAAAAGADR
jgi:hypothetical protein